MTIQILIKNPSASVEDFRVDMDRNNTVYDLKKHLNAKYTGNPPPERQKLIFSGKLLLDNTTLSDVFKQNDTTLVQTIHIVVSKAPAATYSSNQSNQTSPNPTPNFHNTFNTTTPNTGFAAPNFNTGLNVPPNFNNPAFIEQQQLLQQQFLLQQRLAAERFAQFQQQMRVQYAQQAQQQQQVAPPPQDQMRRRESPFWLIVKLAFMVYLFSQGGSTSRIVFLSIGAFLIFLYQTGLFRITATQTTTNVQQPPPGQRGLINELVLPFFFSLIPTWQPNTHQDAPPQPAAPADPEPAPLADQMMG